MDEMRAMLDSLMGKDRNAFGEDMKKKVTFKDGEVCKYFLLDFCPHDLFPNTRSDLGPCLKEHRSDLKSQFENDSNHEYYKALFENDFQKFLRRLVDQMENRIKRVQQRIDQSNEPASKDQEEKIKNMKQSISELLHKQDEAGSKGDFEEAEKLNEQVQALQQQVQSLVGSGGDGGNAVQLRVCNVCGALQSVGDAAVRFEAHASGKQHTGFLKIRQTLAQLESEQDQRGKFLYSRKTHDGKDDQETKSSRSKHSNHREERGYGRERYDGRDASHSLERRSDRSHHRALRDKERKLMSSREDKHESERKETNEKDRSRQYRREREKRKERRVSKDRDSQHSYDCWKDSKRNSADSRYRDYRKGVNESKIHKEDLSRQKNIDSSEDERRPRKKREMSESSGIASSEGKRQKIHADGENELDENLSKRHFRYRNESAHERKCTEDSRCANESGKQDDEDSRRILCG